MPGGCCLGGHREATQLLTQARLKSTIVRGLEELDDVLLQRLDDEVEAFVEELDAELENNAVDFEDRTADVRSG